MQIHAVVKAPSSVDKAQAGAQSDGQLVQPPADNAKASPQIAGQLAQPPADNAKASPQIAGQLAQPPADNAKASPQIEGSVDEFGPLSISGWAFDRANPERALEVDLLADHAPVLTIRADRFRPDLLAAGLGDGKHAFEVAVPEVLLDGGSHEVEVRERASGKLLPNGAQFMTSLQSTRAEVVLDGLSLRGHARVPAAGLNVERVVLVEEGAILAEGKAWDDSDRPGVVEYAIPVPSALFDGRPHAFIIRTSDLMMTLGVAALAMPFHLTPEASLLRFAREGVTPAMSMLAAFRYEALTGAVAALSVALSEETDPTAQRARQRELAQLSRVHRRLVRGFDERDTRFEPLAFPEVQHPKVSIVIPLHNQFHVTYHCLASLLLAQNDAGFEVILVDDGSKDRTTEIPKLISGVSYVRNEVAEGFIRASNKGAVHARGDYVVMLNNDTEVTHKWLDELLWPFVHFEGVGMTGAKLIYPDGRLQEAGGVVWSSGNPWNYGRHGNARDPQYNYTRQVDYLSGACIMLPRPLWEEIGGFSEAYLPAYFEDTDLAFQVRSRGFKSVYAPMAEVVHFEGQSNGTSVASGTKRYQEINRPKFKTRWAGVFRNNGKEGVDLHLHKDRNVSQRALVIDAETPMPDKSAGAYAAISELRMLQALGFKCTFVPLNAAWMGNYTRELQRMGVECLYAPFMVDAADVIRRRGKEFDLVYITRYYVAGPLIDLVRQYAPQAKIALCNADLHFLRELRAALHNGSAEGIDQAVKTREAELAVMRKVDVVLSYTDVEKAVIASHNLASTKTATCPWVTEVRADVPGFAERKDIAFLGGYRHYPNVEAVKWFAAEVMPLMRQRLPGVRLRVYGADLPDTLLELADKHPDVSIDGWVAEVAEVYDTCRIFIAPLQSGAGIKGKVIAALAAGVPCVLSPLAAEGIPISDGVEGFVAVQPANWAAAIGRVYQDEALWAAVSRAGRRFTEAHYGTEKGIFTMQKALEVAEMFCARDNAALAAG